MEHGMGKRASVRLDACISILLAILIFFVALYGTTDYPAWGDDFAAYYNDAIAIAEGTTEEQHRLNYLYHPSPLPTEAEDGTLKYVWGYPLLLSLVYRIVGFDRVTFDSFVYYKLVSVVCFALSAAVMYLFFRRRFSLIVSVMFTLFVGTNSYILSELSTQYSDVVYMFFSIFALYLTEVLLSTKSPRAQIACGILLGIILWFTHEIRLNGVLIVGIVALSFILYFIKHRKKMTRRSLGSFFLPFCVFAVLSVLSESFFLWTPTGNSSDFSSTSFSLFAENLKEFYYMVRDWIAFSLAFDLVYYPIPWILKMAARIVIVLALAGAVKCIMRFETENIPYVILIAVLFLATSMLSYNQGKRYIFPVLPFILLFVGEGAKLFLQSVRFVVLKNQFFKNHADRFLPTMAKTILLGYCLFTIIVTVSSIVRVNPRNTDIIDGPYSQASVEMYGYIQENIEEDALIITCKPRALYLNTQRKAIPFENGHTIDEADYFLRNINSSMMDYFLGESISAEQKSRMTELYRTDSFVLYSIDAN